MNIEEFSVAKFYDSGLFSFYRDARFKAAVKMSSISDFERVLDFGCFRQSLRKFLPLSIKYFGYDKNKGYSDGEWKDRVFDCVFALAVFEHIPKNELEMLVDSFAAFGFKKIVAEFPWEDSPVNRFMTWFFGMRFEHELTHPSGWKVITKALNKRYECIKYRNLFWSTWISVWELKK